MAVDVLRTVVGMNTRHKELIVLVVVVAHRRQVYRSI